MNCRTHRHAKMTSAMAPLAKVLSRQCIVSEMVGMMIVTTDGTTVVLEKNQKI